MSKDVERNKGKELMQFVRDKGRKIWGAVETEAKSSAPPLQSTSSGDDGPGIPIPSVTSTLSPDSNDDLDVPIAIRKKIRECTKHSL